MNKRPRVSVFWELATQKTSLLNAIKIGLVGGSVLNLINQGAAIFALDPTQLQPSKLLLTFLVPFLVSTYASTTTRLQFLVGQPAAASAQLRCKGCGQTEVVVAAQELLEPCALCGPETDWKVNQYITYKEPKTS